MKRTVLLGFLLLLAFDTAGQVGVRLAADKLADFDGVQWLMQIAREPFIGWVLLCYLGAFLTYVTLLKHAPVGPAYAAAHGHIVTVLIISYFYFEERLTPLQTMGAVAIMCGVVLLAVTETSGTKPPPEAQK
jgi:multidrug transporter EmrE-like cation transporter